MDRGSKSVETSYAQDYDNDHENESELRLVDATVFASQCYADIVVERTRNRFSDNAKDKRGERRQTSFADREVVWRRCEQDAVHDREDTVTLSEHVFCVEIIQATYTIQVKVVPYIKNPQITHG